MSNGGVNQDIRGIMVMYCDEDGKPQQTWLDLSQMQAISWTSNPIGAKPQSNPQAKAPPHTTKPVEKCDKDLTGSPGSFCWWDGSQWVCGEL